MDNIYTICMVIGIIIPVIGLIMNGLDDIFGGIVDGISEAFNEINLDFDLGIDIGNTTLCLLPFSMQSICTGLLVFGVSGKIIYNGNNILFANIISLIIAYFFAIIMQTFITGLKRVENTTYTREQLMLFDAKVVNTIKVGSYGSISIKTDDGITNTYPAKALDSTLEIKQNTIVSIVEFKKNVAIVEIKN